MRHLLVGLLLVTACGDSMAPDPAVGRYALQSPLPYAFGYSLVTAASLTIEKGGTCTASITVAYNGGPEYSDHASCSWAHVGAAVIVTVNGDVYPLTAGSNTLTISGKYLDTSAGARYAKQ